MRILLSLVAPALVGGLVFLLQPAGQVATAEGCSGGGGSLSTPSACWALREGDVSWDMANQDVPTDAPLRFALAKKATGCTPQGSGGSSAGEPIKVEVRDADGALVPGGPEVVSYQDGTVYGQDRVAFEWTPSQPLQASSTYSLRLTGVGAGGSTPLTLTTAAGPYVFPALAAPHVATSFHLVGRYPVACTVPKPGYHPCSSGHENLSYSLLETSLPMMSVELDEELSVPDSIRPHVSVTFESSEAGLPFEVLVSTTLAPRGAVRVALFAGRQGPFCVRLRYENQLTQESTTSPPTCLDLDAFVLPEDRLQCEHGPDGAAGHCDTISDPDSAAFFAARCGAAGPGSSGASGQDQDGGDGCQAGRGARPGLVGLGLLGLLGLAARRRRAVS